MKEQFIDDSAIFGVGEDLHKAIKEKILKRVDAILPCLKDKDVLSVGCGSGFSENEYSKVARSVVGVDIDENAISYAREHYKDIDFYCYDAIVVYPLLFKDNMFEVVVCTEVLEHMSKSNAEKVLDGIRHMLVDEGMLVGTVPVEDDVGSDQFHKVHYPLGVLQEMLGNYFKEVTIEKIEHPHPQYFFGNSWLFRCVK
jgi:2-polyprenyl-3-methyl-5-hydroxy-6-metoxy-1,4-benzoquinol methylase